MTGIIPSTPPEIAEVPNSEVAIQPQKLRVRRRRSHQPKPFRRVRRLFRRIKLRNVLIIAVSIVAVVVVGIVAVSLNATSRAESALANLDRIMVDLQGQPGTALTLADFDRLDAGLNDVVNALTSASRLAAFVRPIQSVNSDLAGTLSVLDAAQNMALAARNMLTGLQPALFFLVDGSDEQAIVANISSGERVVDLLRLGRGQFTTSAELLASAREKLEALSRADLSSSLVLTAEKATSYLEQLEQINQILLASPDLLTQALGLGEETSYLVLAQNNDELRPSGGYLSTYGWLTLRNGRITDYSFGPTTATSPNPPSESAGLVEVPSWWISYAEPVYAAWDGSWYADFPSTADMAMWYYNTGDNPQSPVGAVISIDVSGFETILEGLGSVTLPAYDVVVTPENFREVVYDIRAFGEGELPHKQFVAALYRQILSEWQDTADAETNERLLGVLLGALQDKHIMIYFADPALNEAVDLLGWSGRQEAPVGHDYLLVADANLGNKSNRSVLRQLTYDVVLGADRSANGRLTVGYDYSARVANADPAVDEEHHGPLDYRNLLQVFVPPGAALNETAGFSTEPLVLQNGTHTIFVSRFVVPFDSYANVQYSYSVPQAIEAMGAFQRYRLLIQQQPGAQEEAVSVQIQLPPGASIVGVTPEPAASYTLEQPILEFQFMLGSDQWVEVVYSSP